jgi:hypothetical protein
MACPTFRLCRLVGAQGGDYSLALARAADEVSAETPSDGHLILIVIRNKNVRLSISGRVVHDGAAIPGMLQITEPTVFARCVFRGPYDVLHLHVQNSMIAELNRDLFGCETVALRSEAALIRDPIAEWLARALLAVDDDGAPFRQLYADHISNAIVMRLLAPRAPLSTRPKVAELFPVAPEASHRIRGGQSCRASEPSRSRLGGGPYAHPLRRRVQGRHGSASARIPSPPPRRTGAGDARPRPCIDRWCRSIERVGPHSLAGHSLSDKTFIDHTFARLSPVLPQGAQLHNESTTRGKEKSDGSSR